MLIMPSFKKSLIVEQFQGNYLNLKWARDPKENQHLVSGQLKKKTRNLDKLYTWARDMVTWYWSVDTLFWQVSIDHNMDVQYQRNKR